MATVSAPPPPPPPLSPQPIFMPAPPSSTGLFPVPESFTQWFYMDPQREMQGKKVYIIYIHRDVFCVFQVPLLGLKCTIGSIAATLR